jgi:hypothetical protein
MEEGEGKRLATGRQSGQDRTVTGIGHDGDKDRIGPGEQAEMRLKGSAFLLSPYRAVPWIARKHVRQQID